MSKKDPLLSDINSKIYMYFIMPHLGANLDQLFKGRGQQFTPNSIYSLGIQLLNIHQQVHSAGFVFNDLKLDNLMLDFDSNEKLLLESNDDIFEDYNVNIIDFGYATSYLKQDGQSHIKKKVLDFFRGNIMFSSMNQMKFHTTSRRDDIISLFYLLTYLLKEG